MTLTVSEMHKYEKQGINLFKLIDIMNLPVEKKKIIFSIQDIYSAFEEYRKTKRNALLKEIRTDKEYNADLGVWYILAEVARDTRLVYALKNKKPKNRLYEHLFNVVIDLVENKCYNLTMLYLIVTLCTILDSDEVINSYDIDRLRGEKRVIEWVKNEI